VIFVFLWFLLMIFIWIFVLGISVRGLLIIYLPLGISFCGNIKTVYIFKLGQCIYI
jgi:hypothetical protein